MSTSDQPHTTTDPPPKTTLFCPDCGHESGAGNDWTVREGRTDSVLTCPDCGAEVATWSQPRGLRFG